jgi:hypothetical protein
MMPLGPATRIYLAAGVTDLRNHSEHLIIPSRATDEAFCLPNLMIFLVSDSE